MKMVEESSFYTRHRTLDLSISKPSLSPHDCVGFEGITNSLDLIFQSLKMFQAFRNIQIHFCQDVTVIQQYLN